MGMFDYVKAENLHCSKCNAELDDFQSKHGPQCLHVYQLEEFLEVTRRNPHIYTSCEKCGTWNEFVIHTPIREINIVRYIHPYHNKKD